MRQLAILLAIIIEVMCLVPYYTHKKYVKYKVYSISL